VSTPLVAPLLQRTLLAVYRFYDVFFYPIQDRTTPVNSPLEVSVPSTGQVALRSDGDFTYRFSAVTLTQPAPVGVDLAVQVVATDGDYASFEPILLTLPLPLSTPPVRGDFLIPTPLWPTVAYRPPSGETAVRGAVRSPTAQPVAGLKVEVWPGASPLPPAGTPYTRTNANGDFLFRFPLLKGTAGTSLTAGIRLEGGAVPVTPSSTSIVLGRTQIIPLQRT
jgi:hypothetical protein